VDPANDTPRTVLVTGATDGIGRAAAAVLVARGARVMVHGRAADRIERAAGELRERGGDDRVAPPLRADFSRLDEVRSMAAELAARGTGVDVLINNAGVFTNQPLRTADGFERTWVVNHLAPFLLTHLVLATQADRPPSRIVFVTSDAHAHGHVNPDDPGGARLPFDRLLTYCGTKLANLLTALELSHRLAARGVAVNALHPGIISTKLLTEGYGGRGPDSLDEAARALARLALDDALEGVTGRYYDRGREARPAPVAVDRALAARFYEASAAAIGITPLPPA